MLRSSGFYSSSSTVHVHFSEACLHPRRRPSWSPFQSVAFQGVRDVVRTLNQYSDCRSVIYSISVGKGDKEFFRHLNRLNSDTRQLFTFSSSSLYSWASEHFSVHLSHISPSIPRLLALENPAHTRTHARTHTHKNTRRQAAGQIILLRLCVGESVMTSLHWVEFRFLVPPPPAEAEPVESRCSAISSEMKVFRSTSWSPLRLLRHTGPEPEEPPPPAPPPLLLLPLTCVGDPGAPDRTLILAIAPLRPVEAQKDKNE